MEVTVSRRTQTGFEEPELGFHGPVAVWWIPRPPAPRTSLRAAALGWLALLPATLGALLWLWSESRPLWPFGRQVNTASEILLRYELILLTYLAYVTLRSLPVWLRYRRLARRDAANVEIAIGEERWEKAALYLHRCCLLTSAVWRKVPARVTAWDSVIRPHLSRHRRVYVYYARQKPELPPDVAASFAPMILPPPQPPLWSAAALIPVAILLYLLVMDILRSGYWQRAILFNAVLLMLILISYGLYFSGMLFGRAQYLRFAPGAFQIVRYSPLRRRPRIESFDLRRHHAIFDLSSPSPGLTLLDTPGYLRETYRLPRGAESIEAGFRSMLSAAPTPPLPDEHLVG